MRAIITSFAIPLLALSIVPPGVPTSGQPLLTDNGNSAHHDDKDKDKNDAEKAKKASAKKKNERTKDGAATNGQ